MIISKIQISNSYFTFYMNGLDVNANYDNYVNNLRMSMINASFSDILLNNATFIN
jgi:hypothetical protein